MSHPRLLKEHNVEEERMSERERKRRGSPMRTQRSTATIQFEMTSYLLMLVVVVAVIVDAG